MSIIKNVLEELKGEMQLKDPKASFVIKDALEELKGKMKLKDPKASVIKDLE